jgi:hypothetical protein
MPNVQSMKGKDIAIVATGTGSDPKRFEVTIHRGATPEDTLKKLKLAGILTKPGDSASIPARADLYPLVEDGEKLMLTPGTPVAAGCSR